MKGNQQVSQAFTSTAPYFLIEYVINKDTISIRLFVIRLVAK